MPETYRSFKEWKRAVSRLIYKHFSLTLDDLPDLFPMYDSYEAGETPEEFFQEEVRQIMIEEFGEVVGEVWPGNDPTEEDNQK